MTIKLLTPRGQYPVNAIVTFDAATEAALVADKVATTNLTGGTAYVAPAAGNTPQVVSNVSYAGGKLFDGNGNEITSLVSGARKPTNPTARLKWFSFGDSYTDVGSVNNTTAQDIRAATASNTPVAMANIKMGAWIAAFSGGLAIPVFNGGIGGQTSSQIATRAAAASSATSTSKSLIDGALYGGTAMVLSCTVNDFTSLTTASSAATIAASQAACLANLKTCIKRAASLGVYTFVHSVMPYGATPLTADQSVINAATAGYNAMVLAYLLTIPTIATYYDARALVQAADGGWIAAYSAETSNHTHPSEAGCYLIYPALADLMLTTFGIARTRQPFPVAPNMFSNAALTASSAGLATGISVVINDGAYTPTLVERNGVTAQQFVWTPGNVSGTDSNLAVEVDLSAAGAAPFVSVAVGDVLALSYDLLIDDGSGNASTVYGLSAYLRKAVGAQPTIFNTFLITYAGTLNKPAQSVMDFKAAGGLVQIDEATGASSGRIFSRITLVTQTQTTSVRLMVSNIQMVKLPAGAPIALIFTAALSAATSGTLIANFVGATGPYTVTFSDGSVRFVTLTNGAATATWAGAVTATAGATYVIGY